MNEAGVAKLGLASPQAAIGELVTINHPSGLVGTFSGEHTAQIVGVVKNFQVILESGHGSPPRADVMRETLTWFDKYLGPVR